MVKYLILGANGLIGRAIVKQLEGRSAWFGTYYKRKEPGLTRVDITADNEMRRVFAEMAPSCVINCSNLAGGVEFCNSHPDLAREFHFQANMSIGTLCERYNSRIVFISTDYVFDGKNPPYKESDSPNPMNIYGKLKLESENWLINNVPKSTIIRTTNVFGWDPQTVTPNYMMNLYMAIKENREFQAPSFLWGNPTYVDDLSAAIIEMCSNEISGTYHVVGSSFINRLDWAKKACKIAGWDESLIVELKDPPVTMVPRPLRSDLDTNKFRNACHTNLGTVDDGIRRFLKSMGQE